MTNNADHEAVTPTVCGERSSPHSLAVPTETAAGLIRPISDATQQDYSPQRHEQIERLGFRETTNKCEKKHAG